MTYSIVARDPATGELGVAVQSHWFSVGSVVTWAEAGVGAVATQSFAEPAYGPKGLALMRLGIDANTALHALVASDALEARRQVAFIDASGRLAVHTGEGCIAEAGHATADSVSVQANMMRSAAVWPAMLEAYQRNLDTPFSERLMLALEAGEDAGGDVRGKQSAAMMIVRGERSDQLWHERVVDLRVEDSPEPLPELRRLLSVQTGYQHMEAAEEKQIAGEVDAALEEYERARSLLERNDEAAFWTAVLLSDAGRVDEARSLLREISEREPGWTELLKRLPGSGSGRWSLLRDGHEAVRRLLESQTPE